MLEEDKSREVESDQTETGKGEEGEVEVSWPRGKGGKKNEESFFSKEQAQRTIYSDFLKK